MCIGVIGGNEADKKDYDIACELGGHIADRGAVLICGGLGGIMEAVSAGARDHGGTVIGLLPGTDKRDANQHVSIALTTGMGIGRNTLIVQMADVVIAFPGGYGTLSEIALALAIGKTVIYLPGVWDLKKMSSVESAQFKEALDARHAIGLALGVLGNG
jgi:uncharacterized protein (TIGR00725 family)